MPAPTVSKGWRTRMQVWPGHRYPLGATYDGTGTNFAIFSEVAEARRAVPVRPVRQRAQGPAARAGRVRVARLPARGRAGPAVRLPGVRPVRPVPRAALQPAQAAARPVRAGGRRRHRLAPVAVRRTTSSNPDEMSDLDSAPYMAKGVVVNPYFDWGNDRRPDIPYHHSVIYETHVKGLTERHPEVPRGHARHLRGDRPSRRSSSTSRAWA